MHVGHGEDVRLCIRDKSSVQIPLKSDRRRVHAHGKSHILPHPHGLPARHGSNDRHSIRGDLHDPAQEDVPASAVQAVNRDLIIDAHLRVEGNPAGQKAASVIVAGDQCERVEISSRINGEQRIETAAGSRHSDDAAGGSAPRQPNRFAACFAGVFRFASFARRAAVVTPAQAVQCGNNGSTREIILKREGWSDHRQDSHIAVNGIGVVGDGHLVRTGILGPDIGERQRIVRRAGKIDAVQPPLVKEGCGALSNDTEHDGGRRLHILAGGLRHNHRRLRLEIFDNRVIIISAGTFGGTGDIDILLAVQCEGHGRIAVMGRAIVARNPGLRPVSILIFDRDEI